jgi:phosphoribosylaminoimidazolecarboxamide formyltransferase/IMP cyclohydrolase
MPTALFSVYDKKGLLPLAKGLKALGWDILATGGTLNALRSAEVEVMEVAEYTGAPEAFGGRVKTLHPRIHGGLLFRRDVPEHVADAARLGIGPIDLVVVNLYPFEATIAKPGVTVAECIEQIDIGGPSMLRSSAKNHAAVTVLTDPGQYPRLPGQAHPRRLDAGGPAGLRPGGLPAHRRVRRGHQRLDGQDHRPG